ncbi:hypothetical protein INT46_011168 [Mucor plumbeus]|uniref:Uncharacterized protein n=1 Tax=Mucor plumbeus TaxID=97098 RepID=A0A8H7QWL8_9FUNG|nr:hypothetical protein INT46_011168 [Mucor plumbeus]
MSNKYPKVDYINKTPESLILRVVTRILELEELYDWKVVAYLSDFYKKDPIINETCIA